MVHCIQVSSVDHMIDHMTIPYKNIRQFFHGIPHNFIISIINVYMYQYVEDHDKGSVLYPLSCNNHFERNIKVVATSSN